MINKKPERSRGLTYMGRGKIQSELSYSVFTKRWHRFLLGSTVPLVNLNYMGHGRILFEISFF